MEILSRLKEAEESIVTREILKSAVPEPAPDSHKNQNGRILIVGGSPLFHGAGRMAARAAAEITLAFASRTNDMVYFCSTEKNIAYLKQRQEAFLGIGRKQFEFYLQHADVVVIGPGLMREPEVNFPETEKEPSITRELTEKVLASEKKAVLDAGSLQIISPEQLRGKDKIIITPHRTEMGKLFGIEPGSLATSARSSFAEIKQVADRVKEMADEYGITILLKGPIDIIASPKGWYFSPGGNAGMTKGGTGDVLAGVVAALYSRIDDPLLAAAAGSFLAKRAGEDLWEDYRWVYNAEDLVSQASRTLVKILAETLKS